MRIHLLTYDNVGTRSSPSIESRYWKFSPSSSAPYVTHTRSLVSWVVVKLLTDLIDYREFFDSMYLVTDVGFNCFCITQRLRSYTCYMYKGLRLRVIFKYDEDSDVCLRRCNKAGRGSEAIQSRGVRASFCFAMRRIWVSQYY